MTTKTRRPIGHKIEPDGPDPETPIATFLYREDAVEFALAAMDKDRDRGDRHGYSRRVLYSGAWMRWSILARRRSWTYDRWMNADGTLGDRW